MRKRILYLLLGICVGAMLLSGCGKEKSKETEKKNETTAIEKEGYVLDWHDEFDGTELDSEKWLPQYLPHNTSSPEGCMTNYTMADGSLKLVIDENSVDYYNGEKNRTDGGFMASSIQTYEKTGLHMKDVKTTVAPYTGYVTQYGYFELRCKMPDCGGGGIAAWWMVGAEYDAKKNGQGTKQNGEIDIFETFFLGTNVFTPKVHAWDDPDLSEWQQEVVLDGEASDYTEDWHTYAMDWTPEHLVFYVDGKEVARTNQSPQYDMCMLLSLYTSNYELYWGGGAANDVYPKEWEIDYIRVWKDENGYPNAQTKPKERESAGELIESQLYTGGGDPAVDFNIYDYARLAKLKTTEELVSNVNFIRWPGYDAENGCCTADNPTLPAEYIFTWDSPQNVDTMNLYSYFASGQAPTEIELQVQKTGGEWTSVAAYEIEWKTNTAIPEYAKMAVPNADGITGLKVIVKDANLSWKHYVIQKIHIYKEGEPYAEVEVPADWDGPGENNLAPSASISTNVEGVSTASLNDGLYNTLMWRAGTAEEIAGKDYYQLNWNDPVSVSQFILTTTKARNQGPTAWHIQVSKDGQNDWTDVASVTDKQWKQLGDVTEKEKSIFTLQENIKGIRIWIDNANLEWAGYGVQEIEVY